MRFDLIKIYKEYIFKPIYHNLMLVILPFWIIISFNLIVYFKFNECVVLNDNLDVVLYSIWISTTILLFVVAIISFYFWNKTKDNIGNRQQNFEIGDHTGEANSNFASEKMKIVILPLYILWIFAVSRLIVIIHGQHKSFQNVDTYVFIEMGILLIILLVSFTIWKKFKSNAKKQWSFITTIYAVLYILLNVCWDDIYPYVKSYAKVINCIFIKLIAS